MSPETLEGQDVFGDNLDMFSTACTTPNLSQIDETYSLIERASVIVRNSGQEGIEFDTLRECLEQAGSSLFSLKHKLAYDMKGFQTKLRQQYDEQKHKMRLKRVTLLQDRRMLRQEKKALKLKEEDLHHEVHQLLATIDDHTKLNVKLNKHYQKRLLVIESDLKSLGSLVTQDLKMALGKRQLEYESTPLVQTQSINPN